jgi:hypothetical protein
MVVYGSARENNEGDSTVQAKVTKMGKGKKRNFNSKVHHKAKKKKRKKIRR